MEELRAANASGDPERIRKALDKLREALDRYSSLNSLIHYFLLW